MDNGSSLEDIRKKIVKGEIKTQVARQLAKKKFFMAERIQRKKRDVMQLLTKFSSEPKVQEASSEPQMLSAVQQFAREKENHIADPVLSKTIYKLADKELVVNKQHNIIFRFRKGVEKL